MKLVEILAKELGEWPEHCKTITQDCDGDVGSYGVYKPELCNDDPNDAVWTHIGHIENIARLSSIATDHATAIVTREMWQVERDKQSCERVEEVAAEHLACIAKDSCNVILMRDRIREIDATIEAMTAERAELVRKLAGDGFALIVQTAELVEGKIHNEIMAGDFVEYTRESNDEFTNGNKYKVLSTDESRAPYNVIDDDGEDNCLCADECKFHSRPSA